MYGPGVPPCRRSSSSSATRSSSSVRSRLHAHGTPDSAAPHPSFALQNGYKALLRNPGKVSTSDLDDLMNRLLLSGDARDVTRARDSLLGILGL